MKKTILITGGAGFLGSHLCERLVNNGLYVICLDNLYTGSIQNISHLVDNPLFEFLEHNVINPLSLNVDEIYHFACPASPVHYQQDPIQTTKTSVYGTINMLDLAKSSNAKILLASTSEIYGNPQVHPQTENYWGNVNPIGPRSCYDEGKRCSESLFFDYHRKYNLRIKVARIFNTYGPCMQLDDGRVISNFIVQALRKQNITIYGDGLQSRTFCYIDDLINVLIQLMQSDNQFTGPINLGSPNEVTMLELCNRVQKLTGSKSIIVYEPLPINDPIRRKPDIALAKRMFGWEPTISLDCGLKNTILYFEKSMTKSKISMGNSLNIKYQNNLLAI